MGTQNTIEGLRQAPVMCDSICGPPECGAAKLNTAATVPFTHNLGRGERSAYLLLETMPSLKAEPNCLIPATCSLSHKAVRCSHTQA
jgi:hypothetical protein